MLGTKERVVPICLNKSYSLNCTKFVKMILRKNHYKSSAVAEMGDRGHIDMGRKVRGCCAPFAGGWVPF